MRRNKGYNNNYIHVAVQGDKLYKVLFIQGIIYRYIYIHTSLQSIRFTYSYYCLSIGGIINPLHIPPLIRMYISEF
jgi:hypothetical protein